MSSDGGVACPELLEFLNTIRRTVGPDGTVTSHYYIENCVAGLHGIKLGLVLRSRHGVTLSYPRPAP